VGFGVEYTQPILVEKLLLAERLNRGRVLKNQFTIFFGKSAKAIQTVLRITEYVEGLDHACQLLGQFCQSDPGFDRFSFARRHHTYPMQPARVLRYAWGSAPQPMNPPKMSRCQTKSGFD
jgi:hypothetical protein